MRHVDVDTATLQHWLALSRRGEIDIAIRAVHDRIATGVRTGRPVCTASGRCCDFGRFGHDLFVTGLEVAWTLDRIPASRAIDAADVEASASRGDCPFLVGDGTIQRCGVHPARPVGCRVFFCDPSRERLVEDLAESGARAIREIHDRFEVPYLYAEWRGLLRAFTLARIASSPERPMESDVHDPFVRLTRGGASSGGSGDAGRGHLA